MNIRGTFIIGFVLPAVIVVGGCDSKNNRAAAAPSPQLRETAAMSAPVARPAPASSRMQIHGPRPQHEVDALYAPATLPPVVRSSEPRTAPTPPPVAEQDERITAEPSWDTQITRDWRHIVIHHSASPTGSAASFDKAHRERGWDGLGYHFVIGNGTGSADGEVEVGYRWSRQTQGAHAGNAEYNQAGIGICLVGDFQHGGRPSARQMSNLRRLVRFLQAKTGVPTSEVIGHGNVPGKSTECPGQYLDLAAFRSSLGNGAFGVNIHVAKGSNGRPPIAPTRTRYASGGAAMP